jgi:uncharacterized membrane protein
MIYLVFGLLLFLGIHSTRVFADGWRLRMVARLGDLPWKGFYAALSLTGLALLVWGYAQARQQPVLIWSPPVAMRHIAALLTLFSFVLLAAAYIPANHIKARLHHPMVLATKGWAFAHLLANGNLADVVLFGGFLVWSIVLFASSRRRDRREAKVYPAGRWSATVLTFAVGTLAWAAFALWLHAAWIGVKPFA